MIKTLTSAFKNKDIRKKLLYTLMMLVVIRIGSLLPILVLIQSILVRF